MLLFENEVTFRILFSSGNQKLDLNVHPGSIYKEKKAPMAAA